MNQLYLYLSPPANWQDFQVLVGEIARVKFVADSVQEYGRQGQRQNGVDVYAVDVLDQRIGIQCKETKKDKLPTHVIDEEIAAAKKFSPPINVFILATTLRIDVNLQDHVNGINASKKEPFKVQVWFWDDINRWINLSQSVMSSYYAGMLLQFGRDEVTNHLKGMRVGFDRPAFKDNFLHERNYDDFGITLVHAKAMLKTGFLYDRWTNNLVAQIVPSSLIGDREYQKFLQRIEKDLESIYQAYLVDKKAVTSNPKQLEERAGDYNISRRKLIDLINDRLRKAGIDEIHTKY